MAGAEVQQRWQWKPPIKPTSNHEKAPADEETGNSSVLGQARAAARPRRQQRCGPAYHTGLSQTECSSPMASPVYRFRVPPTKTPSQRLPSYTNPHPPSSSCAHPSAHARFRRPLRRRIRGPPDVPAEEPATVSLDLPDLDDLSSHSRPNLNPHRHPRQALNFQICPTWTARSKDEP